MSRPRSESGGPAAAASNPRQRALTYGDLPPEMKEAIQDYLRFTNESLRAAVDAYFEDPAATERWYGNIGTWDVGRVTDMSKLFRHSYFDEARAGVPSSRRASRSVDSISSTHVEESVDSNTVEARLRRTSALGTPRR